MEKPCTFLILYSVLLIAATNAASPTEDDEAAEEWLQNHLSRQSAKPVRVLHFYVQDVIGGPNRTVYEVARTSITSKSPTSFGQVNVLDDLITAERDRNSKKLGRAQGLDAYVDLQDAALALNIVFVFRAGPFKGSTLSVSGRKSLTSKDAQELPVVGGTGVFRMARGYSISNTISYDPVEKYAVLEYNVYLY